MENVATKSHNHCQSEYTLTRKRTAMPDIDDVIAAFQPWRNRWRRTAYRPITSDQPIDGNISQFGGSPKLLPGESRPTCGRCGNILPLLVQIDLASLPDNDLPWNTGIFQLLYCPRQAADIFDVLGHALQNPRKNASCDDFEAFSECHFLRVIDRESAHSSGESNEKDFPRQDIVEWKQFSDFPGSAEHRKLGLQYDYNFKIGSTETSIHWEEGNVHFENLKETDTSDGIAETISSAEPGDKLLGWPHWAQGVEYPNCPKCDKQMQYFLQIDSQDNLPHMLGDLGCGHVSFCPDHFEQIAFTWACS